MKAFSVFTLGLIISSCGSPHRDPLLEPDVREFEQVTGIPFQGSIQFIDEAPGKSGFCDNGDIYIRKMAWTGREPLSRRALVFHELTHCAAGIDPHDPDPNSYFSIHSHTPESDDDLRAQVLARVRRP